MSARKHAAALRQRVSASLAGFESDAAAGAVVAGSVVGSMLTLLATALVQVSAPASPPPLTTLRLPCVVCRRRFSR